MSAISFTSDTSFTSISSDKGLRQESNDGPVLLHMYHVLKNL